MYCTSDLGTLIQVASQTITCVALSSSYNSFLLLLLLLLGRKIHVDKKETRKRDCALGRRLECFLIEIVTGPVSMV